MLMWRPFPGLTLENAKMINTPKGIAYQVPHSFFSIFHKAPIKYNGRIFPTVEHAYQHDRATYYGKHAIAYQVLSATTPQNARAGRSHEWDLCKQDRLKAIVQAKFNQHHDLRDRLVATGSTPLIEATYDPFWGGGHT